MRKLILPALFLIQTSLVFAQVSPVDSLKMELRQAVRKNDPLAEARARRELAWQQAEAGSAFEALENAQRAKDLFEAAGQPLEAFKTTSIFLIVHQQMHNGDKILEYALPALKYARSLGDSSFIARTLVAVGIGHDEKKEYAKAIPFYLEQLKIEEAMGLSTSVTHLNASSSSSMSGNSEAGLFHAEKCIEQSKMEGDTGLLIFGYMVKSLALLRAGRANEAAAPLAIIDQLGIPEDDIVLFRDLSLIKSMVSAGQGEYRQAYRHHLEFYEMDSTLSSLQRNAQFSELETIYETRKKEDENASLNIRLNWQRFWIFGILAAAFLLGTIVWLQRKRLKINARLLETEKKLVETERRRLAEEQAFHQNSLDNFRQSIREKNSLIESLKLDLEQQAAQTPPGIKLTQLTDEKDKLVSQLSQATILTEADWRNFRQKFERVHTGFFEKFGQSVADATEAELRLAALTKLEMTNAEIASMLGISPESVIKTRYRLRKKLGDERLAALVQAL